MVVTCSSCAMKYDDARASTVCPHEPLMSDADLKQKDAGQKLLGKDVMFAHQVNDKTASVYRVYACGWSGMLELHGLAGEYAPHLFVVMTAAREVHA